MIFFFGNKFYFNNFDRILDLSLFSWYFSVLVVFINEV